MQPQQKLFENQWARAHRIIMNDLQFFDFTQGLDALLAKINIFPRINALTKPSLYFYGASGNRELPDRKSVSKLRGKLKTPQCLCF